MMNEWSDTTEITSNDGGLTFKLSPWMKICMTNGDRMRMFSIFSGAIYSPCDNLKICFKRSIIFNVPLSIHFPISPVWSHPFASNTSRVRSGSFNENCSLNIRFTKFHQMSTTTLVATTNNKIKNKYTHTQS